jgi:hypothetical protein
MHLLLARAGCSTQLNDRHTQLNNLHQLQHMAATGTALAMATCNTPQLMLPGSTITKSTSGHVLVQSCGAATACAPTGAHHYHNHTLAHHLRTNSLGVTLALLTI